MKFSKILTGSTVALLSANCFAEGEAAAVGGGLSSLVMFGAIFVLMYFMMIRPQTKRAKEHKNLISGITQDDEVITVGGVLGKVTKVTDAFLVLKVAEGVDITVQRQSVSQALPKGTIKSI